MTEAHQQKTLKWDELVPSGWFTTSTGSSFWMTGYRVFRVPKEMLVPGPKIVDLAQVRAVLLFGKLTYQDSSQVQIELISETDWRVNAAGLRQRETPEGAYLLLLCPFDRDGNKGNEAATRQAIAVHVGLLAALFGRNIVYHRLFDNIVHCGTNQITSFSPTLENPLWFPEPNIDNAHLGDLRGADAKLASLAESDKRRFQLALRWFESALFDGGIDAFLKYWIALETVGMPDTTNVRPLNESLARAYNISADSARDRFGIGRLFGLRSRIVHEGLLLPIHGELLSYVEAIFTDVLRQEMGLVCVNNAAAILSKPTFNIDKYLAGA